MRWLLFLLVPAAVLRRAEGTSCFSTEHTPCQHFNSSNFVSVEVLPVADTEFLQHTSSLVCYHERANSSVCWSEETVQALCDGLNCSSLKLSLAISGHELTSSRLGELLLREDTQLALMLAGYSLHRVHTDDEVPPPVPVVSWVCLCVGLLLSTLVVSKPLWWDRFIHRLCRNSK